jgi:hypothetical protein
MELISYYTDDAVLIADSEDDLQDCYMSSQVFVRSIKEDFGK